MILIVDDDKDFLESLARRLELRGFCVDATASVNEALAKLRDPNSPYKLILVDFSMSGERLPFWQEAATGPTPVYVMTGHASGFPGEQEVLAAGIRGIFHKPIDLENLLETLQNHGLIPKQSP